jgi:hypothetical protein
MKLNWGKSGFKRLWERRNSKLGHFLFKKPANVLKIIHVAVNRRKHLPEFEGCSDKNLFRQARTLRREIR